MFTSVAFLSILPETLILILGVTLLVVEPFWKEERRRNLGWLTGGGLLAILVISILVGRPGDPTSTLGNTIRYDWLGFFFKMLFIFGAGMTALFLMDHEKVGRRGKLISCCLPPPLACVSWLPPPTSSCFTWRLKPPPFRSMFWRASCFPMTARPKRVSSICCLAP